MCSAYIQVFPLEMHYSKAIQSYVTPLRLLLSTTFLVQPQ